MKVEYNTVREIFSCAILCGGKMLLCADKQNIYFYELETGKRIGMYRDLHSDVVNNLIAHPTYPTVFASGSEDGLVDEAFFLPSRSVCLTSLEGIRMTLF